MFRTLIAALMILTISNGGASGIPARANELGAQKMETETAESAEAMYDGQIQKMVAIVIDDFGNHMKGTKEMLDMPVHFTAAVMPFMPSTKEDAEEAYRLGHDVIVHLPLEPMKGKKEWLGPGAITVDMSDEEIRTRTLQALADVPHAVGMNNHMGSKATADERVMRIILTVCKEKGKFFLDSRTTHKTVIPKIAKELGMTYLRNQLFLDDTYSEAHVSRQFGKMKELLEENDTVITIGHVGAPGKHTAAVLKRSIPTMAPTTRFVKLSDLFYQADLMNRPMKLTNP